MDYEHNSSCVLGPKSRLMSRTNSLLKTLPYSLVVGGGEKFGPKLKSSSQGLASPWRDSGGYTGPSGRLQMTAQQTAHSLSAEQMDSLFQIGDPVRTVRGAIRWSQLGKTSRSLSPDASFEFQFQKRSHSDFNQKVRIQGLFELLEHGNPFPGTAARAHFSISINHRLFGVNISKWISRHPPRDSWNPLECDARDAQCKCDQPGDNRGKKQWRRGRLG